MSRNKKIGIVYLRNQNHVYEHQLSDVTEEWNAGITYVVIVLFGFNTCALPRCCTRKAFHFILATERFF